MVLRKKTLFLLSLAVLPLACNANAQQRPSAVGIHGRNLTQIEMSNGQKKRLACVDTARGRSRDFQEDKQRANEILQEGNFTEEQQLELGKGPHGQDFVILRNDEGDMLAEIFLNNKLVNIPETIPKKCPRKHWNRLN